MCSSTAVVPYVNEVPFTAGGVGSFFDLESIQVLKGPQGTLFGRNATGGAVLSTTAKPQDDFSGFLKAGYGNFDAINAEGAINLPIAENTVALRAAFKIARRDGYIKNVWSGPVVGGNDNSRLGELHSDAFRLSLRVNPSEAIESLTVFQYERTKGNNSGTHLYSVNPCGGVGPDGSALNGAVACLYGPQMDAAFGFAGAWAGFLAANPGVNPGGIYGALDRQRNELGFWEVVDDSPSFHRGKDWFVTNSTSFEISEDTVIKNIFGYSSSNAIDSTGQTGEPFILITNYDANRPLTDRDPRSYGNEVSNKSISNELQLQGKALAGGLDYIVGVYYQQLKNHTQFPQSYFGLAPWAPTTTTTSHFKIKDTSKAVFGHMSFDLGELANLSGLKFSVGGRYTWEKIAGKSLPGDAFDNAAVWGTRTNFKDDRASWNVGLEYQVNPDLMFYLAARESWRSGGINGVAPPELDKFKSEVAQDFEAGMKFNGRVADRPARLFLSVYTMGVKNVQRVLFPAFRGGSVAVTANAPKARIKGFEVETGIQPADWLDLGFNVAHTDAKYTNGQVTVFPGSPDEASFNFGPFGDTPKWTGSAYAVVSVPIQGDNGILKMRGDIYAQSHNYFSNTENSLTPGTRLRGYHTINLRMDWENVMGSDFSIGAFAKNAFNEKYYVGGLPLGISLGVNSGNVARPAMYGVEAKYSF